MGADASDNAQKKGPLADTNPFRSNAVTLPKGRPSNFKISSMRGDIRLTADNLKLPGQSGTAPPDPFADLVERTLAKRAELQETFIASYLKATGLGVDQVVLFEQVCADGQVRWWLEPKGGAAVRPTNEDKVRPTVAVDKDTLRRFLDDAARGQFFVRPGRDCYEIVRGTAHGLTVESRVKLASGLRSREEADAECQRLRDRWVTWAIEYLSASGL